MIVQSGFTRWLSHDKVTEVWEVCFFAVLFTLREDSDPAAQGLFRWMCTKEFIQCLLMMRDILPKLASVNRVFQSSTCDPIQVQNALQNLYMVLEGYKTETGPCFKTFDTFVAQLSAHGEAFVPKNTQFYFRLDMVKLCTRYCERLISHLKARFPDLGMMVSLCKIFDCHKFPKEHAALSELNGDFDLVVSAQYDGMAGLGDNVPARAPSRKTGYIFRGLADVSQRLYRS